MTELKDERNENFDANIVFREHGYYHGDVRAFSENSKEMIVKAGKTSYIFCMLPIHLV